MIRLDTIKDTVIMDLKHKELHLDPFNRLQRQKHITDLHKYWNIDLCGVLLVWEEPSTYRKYVLDGQHRYLASIDLVEKLKCEVLIGYSRQEAYDIREKREAATKAASVVDLFRYKVAAGDLSAVALERFITRDLQLALGASKGGVRQADVLSCLGMVQTLWAIDKEVTRTALFAARQAFHDEPLRASTINGLFRIQQFAAPGHDISDPFWTDRLQDFGQSEFIKRFPNRGGSKSPQEYYYLVLSVLNDSKAKSWLNWKLRSKAFTLVPLSSKPT